MCSLLEELDGGPLCVVPSERGLGYFPLAS